MTKRRTAGALAAPIVLLLVLAPSAWAGVTPVFTVNETGDQADAGTADGNCDRDTGTNGSQCTLRAAIEQANFDATADDIRFNLTGGTTISPATPLPPVSQPVTIDGITGQPGASAGTPVVELDGTSTVGTTDSGLDLTADNVTVRGLVINRFSFHGINIRSPADDSTIEGNFLGVGIDGSTDLGNGRDGVSISGRTGITIGGDTAAARNVISGNDRAGVFDQGHGGPGNHIQGNYIGTDKTGEIDVGNTAGIRMFGASSNLVGGTTAADRNVISGNNEGGVSIEFSTGQDTSGNDVQGNYIGTDDDGQQDLGNGLVGVSITTQNERVGGTAAGSGNVISGNSSGVLISGRESDAEAATVQGNLIGTNADVTGVLPNTGDGVRVNENPVDANIGGTDPGAGNLIAGNGDSGIEIDSGAVHDVQGNFVVFNGSHGVSGVSDDDAVTPPTAIIGGSSAGAANVIAANGGDGVFFADDANVEDTEISRNAILANAGLGIDLAPDGVTPNDAADADAGPNELQNFPQLTAAVSGASTEIEGTLSSEPNATYSVDFYANDDCDPSGNGEGQTFLGRDTVTLGASGTQSFSETVPDDAPEDGVLTATATDPDGNTSEFSECENVAPQPSISISDDTVTEGNSGTKDAVFTVSLSNESPQQVSVDFETEDGTAESPDDYSERSGTRTFSPGQTEKTIRVPVKGDTQNEDTERFKVRLSNANNASIADSKGVGRITDND